MLTFRHTFGETLDLLAYQGKLYKFYSGQNCFERKQIVGELCDSIEAGWTCCIMCCEVNTGQ